MLITPIRNLLFLLGLTFSFISSGQTVVTISSPDTTETCASNVFTASIVPTSTIGNGIFSITFDPNAQFLDIDNAGFTLNGNTATLLLINLSDSILVNYELYFPCDMIQPLTDSAGVFIPYAISDTILLDEGNGSTTTFLHDYLVGYPYLISDSNPSLSAQSHMGAITTRYLDVYNTGTANYTGALGFLDNLSCTSASLVQIRISIENQDSTTIIPAIVFDNINSADIAAGIINLPNDNGYTFIHIEEDILITDCLNDDDSNNCINNTALSEFDIAWGCDSTDLCKVINQYTATITRDDTSPYIQVYRMEPSGIEPFEQLCLNDPQSLSSIQPSMYTKRKFAFVNEGDFPALNVNIRLAEEGGNIQGNDFKNDMVFEQNVAVYDANGATILPSTTGYALAATQTATECFTEAINNNFLPISSIMWQIPQFAPGDTLFLEYDVFRCCPQDSIYYSEPAVFDEWVITVPQIIGSTGGFFSNECNALTSNFYSFQVLDAPPEGPYSCPYPRSHALNMTHSNLTPISTMTGGPGTCNEDGSQVFEVLTTSFNSSTNIDGISQFFTPTLGGSPMGILRVNVILDQGLQYVSGDVLELVNNSSTSPIPILTPTAINLPTPLNPTQTIVSLEFDLISSPLSNYSELRNFLLNSVLRFELTPCCPAINDHASYTIQWDLNVSGPSCFECWVPLSRISRNINILCPGCVTPGIIVDNMSIERINFGWQDANNNGLVDVPQNAISDDSVLVIQSNKFTGMPGDTIQVEIGSYFQEGDNTNGGFNYECWLDYWGPGGDTLSYLYVNMFSPCIDSTSFNWQLISDSMQIWSIQTQSWSNWFDISGLVEHIGNQYFHKITLADARAAGAIPDSVYFDENDRYEYKMTYRICGNDTGADHVSECEVLVQSWISGADQAENAFATVPAVPDINSNLTGNDCNARVDSIGPNMIYYCEALSRQFNIVRLYTDVTSYWDDQAHSNGSYWSYRSCRKKMVTTMQLRTGSAMTVGAASDQFNFFPYEYRPIDPSLISLDFEIPNGYFISGSENRTRIPVYISSALYPLWIIQNPPTAIITENGSSGSFTTDFGSYAHAYEAYPVNLTTTAAAPHQFSELLLGDEKLFQRVTIYFSPEDTCATELDTVSLSGLQTIVNYYGNICSSPVISDSLIPSGDQSFIKPTSNLNLTQTGNIGIDSQEACFELLLQNIPTSGVLDNTYVFFDLPPGIVINSVTNVVNGNPFNYNAAGYIELGDIAPQSINFEVCLSLTNCNDLSPISLPIRYGFDCYGYPSSASDAGCWEDTIYVNIVPEYIGLSNGPVTQSTSMDPCGIAHFEACTFPTQNGDIGNLEFTINLPLDAQIVTNSLNVAYTGPNNSNVLPMLVSNTGQSFTYSLDSIWELTTLSESLCISFDYEFTSPCSANMGEPPSVTIGGIAYCGDSILTNLEFTPLDTLGSSCTPVSVAPVLTDHDCLGGGLGTIDLNASGEDTLSFLWSNGDLTEDVSDLEAGNYTVTVTDGLGCSETFNYTIAGGENTGTDTQMACDTYTWIDGVIFNSSNNSAVHVLTNASGCDSTVTLNLTITNSTTGTDTQSACDTYTWIDGVTYNSSNNSATHILTNSVGCDSIVTLDLNITYSNTGTDMQTACDTYTWIDGVTYNSSNNSATHVLTNASGCDSTVTLDLTINESPNILIVSQIDDECGECSGELTVTTPNVGTGTIYDLSPSPDPNTTGVFDSLCSGSYTLTATSAEGCVSTMGITIGVGNQTIALDTVVGHACNNSCVGNINLTVTGGVGPYTYSWSNNSTLEDQEELCPGSYTVTVTDSIGCQVTQTFQVLSTINTVNFSHSQTADCVIEFTNASTSNEGTPNWSWHFGDGTGNNDENPNHTYQNAGIYTVCLTVSIYDFGKCSSTHCDTIDVECITGASNEIANSNMGIEVIPNPTSGVVNIIGEFIEGEDVFVKVHAVDGKLLHESKFSEGEDVLLDLSKEPAGIYMISIQQLNYFHKTKVIKD